MTNLAVHDYETPEGFTPLLPIDDETARYIPLNPGEMVAFKEDHGHHAGMYAVIKAIGYDPDAGGIRLDVLVYDPQTGVTGDETTMRRIPLSGEIQ